MEVTMEVTEERSRREYYEGEWDGVCVRCGHDYFACRGNCNCLSCNGQRQSEIGKGLVFPEDKDDVVDEDLLQVIKKEWGD